MDPGTLPLPVAVLRRRSHNAKSAKDQHDTAYFAWEVSVRLAVALAPPEDGSVLAKASLGAWVSALGGDERMFDDPALLDAFQLFSEVGSDRAARPGHIARPALLGAIPAYRNRVIGHGSVRRTAFYAEAGPILLRGIERAWADGVFWGDERLAFVESVAIDADGAPRGRVLDLMGDHALVVDPAGTRVPEGLRPERVYARSASGWRALHPLVLFTDDDGLERVYLFDAVRGRGARFLDYATGQLLKGRDLERRFPGTADALRDRIGAWRPDAAAAVEGVPTIGPYEVLGEIGRGGMGVVHLARQPDLGRLAAVKVLSEALGQDDVAHARFQREITALGRSDHPNVIRILDSGSHEGRPYYAMEYVEGADLAEVAALLPEAEDFDDAVVRAWRAKREGRSAALGESARTDLSEQRVPFSGDPYGRIALLGRDAARGLQHLHDQGVVHRDIKPANILVTAHHHRAVIMDLGLASLSDASRALTESRGVVGTLRYIAPEQFDPKRGRVDARTDVYALGVVLYELATGTPMFDGDTPARLVEQVLRSPPRRVEATDARVPEDLATIIDKATQRDPRRRYADAASLGADLDAFLERRPIAARPATLRYVLRLAIRRNKPVAVLAAAVVLLVVGGTLGFLLHLNAVKDDEAALRAQAETGMRRARHLAEAMLLELSRYPDSPEMAARVQSFAPTVYAYFGALPVAELNDDELEAHHQAFDWMASHMEAAEEHAAALPHRRRARVLLEEQVRRDPEDDAQRAWLAENWLSEGDTLLGAGETKRARVAWQHGVDIAKVLDPGAAEEETVTAVANLLDGVADTLQKTGAHADSLVYRQVYRTYLEAMIARNPSRWSLKDALLWCSENEGDTLHALGQIDEAIEAWERAQGIRRNRLEETPEDATLEKDLYDRESMIGDALAETPRKREALARYEAAIGGGERLLKEHGATDELREWLAAVHDSAGSVLEDMGREPEGRAHYAKAEALRKEGG